MEHDGDININKLDATVAAKVCGLYTKLKNKSIPVESVDES